MNKEKPEKQYTSDKDTSAEGSSIHFTITDSKVEHIVAGPNASVNYQVPEHQIREKPQALQADILLITATDIETSAVRKHFAGGKELFLSKSTYYDFGIVGDAHVCLAQSEMGSASPGGSLQTVTNGINVFSPKAIIMVGIAFGVGQGQQQLGDILVSRQIIAYEGQKVSTGSDGQIQRIARGDRVTASPWLLGRCHNGALDWLEAKVHFGLLLSGDKLIDNLEFKDQLRSLEREAIGGEMEGAGLYVATHQGNVSWIVVKAICDWADGNKGHRKEYLQQQAAENSARFVYHIIQKGGFHQ